MSLKNWIVEHSGVYRLWQAPFADAKLAPLLDRNDLSRARSVLDVACGPGTNTRHFAHAKYLGVDINERYVESARREHARDFVVGDITSCELGDRSFDFILCNSFFHHVDDESADRILAHLATLLTSDGQVHVLDLVLPESASIARLLARWDRGDHPRPLEAWRRLFERHFEPLLFEPYPLGRAGLTLWSMVYFKGAARKGAARR